MSCCGTLVCILSPQFDFITGCGHGSKSQLGKKVTSTKVLGTNEAQEEEK